MASTDDKADNLKKARIMIFSAIDKGAKLILLPEMFNYLPERISLEGYQKNAEVMDGPTINMLSQIVDDKKVAIIAGSIAEIDQGRIFNTSCLIAPGRKTAYRKIHLFKFGQINESKVFRAGAEPRVADYEGLRIGLTTCFDLRFPELYRSEALLGASIIANVAAFLEKTGRAHWMVLLRARAIENQVFIVAANQAKSERGGPAYYGNSAVIDPWGRILARAGAGEELLVTDIETGRVEEVRHSLPLLDQRRPETYCL